MTRKHQNRPNFVLCVMDDYQHDALGFRGHPMACTPFLDELAGRGVHFTNAFMPGGTDPAVCMPSRAMLHSGRSLFHIENSGQTIPDSHPTIGECLRATGYDAFHTGKWHNCTDSLHRSFSETDEVFLGGMNDPWNTPLYHHDSSGAYDATLPVIRNPMFSNTVEYRRGDHLYAGRHCTDIFCDRAARYIRDHSGERPFFLSLALMAPHDPRTAPPKYHRQMNSIRAHLPDNFLPQPKIDTGVLDIRDEMLAAKPRDAEEIRRHIADYHSMVRHLDDGLAHIMRAIEERSLNTNTFFIFTSDHGLALGQHGLLGKQNLYEHSIRVPLIASDPGVSAGVVRDEEVMHFDIYKTIADLAGASVPGSCDSIGLDLTEIQRTIPEKQPDRHYFAYGSSIRALRQYPYKLVEYAHGNYRATELFDLQTDPGETHNLALQGDYADRIAPMRQTLRKAARSTGDLKHPEGMAFWDSYDSH